MTYVLHCIYSCNISFFHYVGYLQLFWPRIILCPWRRNFLFFFASSSTCVHLNPVNCANNCLTTAPLSSVSRFTFVCRFCDQSLDITCYKFLIRPSMSESPYVCQTKQVTYGYTCFEFDSARNKDYVDMVLRIYFSERTKNEQCVFSVIKMKTCCYKNWSNALNYYIALLNYQVEYILIFDLKLYTCLLHCPSTMTSYR